MDTPSPTLKNLLDKMPIAQADIPHDGASSWLLDLRFANEGYDINEAIEIMESFYPGAERNTQFALTHALLHTNYADSYVLKMLWYYLKEGDRDRLDGLRAQLRPQLEATEYKARINLKTNDAHHLTVLIMLLDGMGSTDMDYSKELSRLLYRKPDHADALEGLALIKRLKADEFNRVSSAYLSEHIAQGHELITQDERKLALINTLFSDSNDLMTYASTSLHKTMENLPSEPALRHPDRYLKNFKEKIDISISWIKKSLNSETEKEFISQIDHMFFMIMQDDWRQEDNAQLIDQILDYLCEQLDQLQAPWKIPLEKALCRRHRGVYDPVYAAGLSLLKSTKHIVMKTLSHKILSELDAKELAEKFAAKKSVLVEIYKHTGNADLIAHMDNKHKHASISHDLGI
jgi:hypothetical protein